MDVTMPKRSKTYSGSMTQSAVWENFTLRGEDIIISTPPKCGTTWTQSITMMLIFGKPGMDIGIGDISLWLDCGFKDQDEIVTRLNGQTHRRCIKSHTPLDGITYSPDATYIAVYRHPMDVHFSMRKHVENLKDDVDLNQTQFPDDIGEGFRMFVENGLTGSGTDDLTVASIIEHYMSFKNWAHLPNIYLFHYADLTRDLAGQMQRLASIYDIEHPSDLMAELVDAATFKRMKSNAHTAPKRTSSVFKNPARFFSTATSNKWEQHLSAKEEATYNARIAGLLTKADRRWLEWGNAG
ncbi:MAG: sulfotransferase domain-containing protein [Paracoccaceae bacterium]